MIDAFEDSVQYQFVRIQAPTDYRGFRVSGVADLHLATAEGGTPSVHSAEPALSLPEGCRRHRDPVAENHHLGRGRPEAGS